MNSLHQYPKPRRKSSVRPMLLIIGGLLLWIGAVALFLMACAIPASWIPSVQLPTKAPTATAETKIERGNPPPWTAVPALRMPTATPLALLPTDPPPIVEQKPGHEAHTTATRATETPSLGSSPVGALPSAVPQLVHTGTLLDIQFIDSYNTETTDNFSRNFYPENNFLAARFPVDRYQLHFQTINQRYELSTIRAELFVPRVDSPTEFPIFVYGSGTTGIGNSCAPLDELTRGRNWGSYRTHMLSYAAQGYIAILPLWQGYDDLTETHPYFVAELESSVMLDAARAVYQFFGAMPTVQTRPAAAIFLAGYSQGGHGAFAADAIAPAYGSELSIKGVIGHASAPNVEALLRETPALSPYIIYAYHHYYGAAVIDPAKVFQEQWLPTFYNDASTKCVDEIYDYYQGGQANIYRPEFSSTLYGGRLGFDFPAFKEALDRNDVGRATNPQVPALLLHGSADPIVTPQTVERFMRQLCRQGKAVTYYLYNNVHHFQTRQYSFIATVQWMQAIMTGTAVRSDCATLLAQ